MDKTLENKVNADPAELEKFNQLAHNWWDPNSEFKPLHEINPLRLNYIDELAGLDGKEVLDVGCGGGILSESMAERGANVTGIDLGDKPLKIAKLHLLESGNKKLNIPPTPQTGSWTVIPIPEPMEKATRVSTGFLLIFISELFTAVIKEIAPEAL